MRQRACSVVYEAEHMSNYKENAARESWEVCGLLDSDIRPCMWDRIWSWG